MPFCRICIFLIFSFFVTSAFSSINVSPYKATEKRTTYYKIPPKKYVAIPLPSTNSTDNHYKIEVTSKNQTYKDITAYLVDENNLRLFKNGNDYKGIGYSRAKAPFSIKGSTNTVGQKFLILDNSHANFITKKIEVSIQAIIPLHPKASEKIEEALSNLYTSLKKVLIFDDFDINVRPCGTVNAFSEIKTGNIYLCTELIDNIFKNDNFEALTFIIFHELGHSLFNIWNLPGGNNEDMADEFATFILLLGGAEGEDVLQKSLSYWKNRDPKAEAMNMIKYGDRHSLSIQRMRNIQENIKNKDDFLEKWNTFIYPHMTTKVLQDIIDNSLPQANIPLAKSILTKRK